MAQAVDTLEVTNIEFGNLEAVFTELDFSAKLKAKVDLLLEEDAFQSLEFLINMMVGILDYGISLDDTLVEFEKIKPELARVKNTAILCLKNFY